MRLRRGGGVRTVGAALLGIALGLGGAGCATYSDRVLTASQAAAGGNYVAAIDSINQVLGVASPTELPAKWGADQALAALERGVLLQSLGRHADAARDFSAAEAEIELIDLSRDPVGSIGAYLYSDSAKPYAATPSERLSLNALNLLNFLAQGDLSGAAVEARRFQAMREYLDSEGVDVGGVDVFGAYLAGFVFEKLGEPDRALRYYEEALAAGTLESLRAPVARLAAIAPYRGPRIEALLSAGAKGASRPPDGEVLIVLGLGRVPYKVPERVPVGAAIGYAGALVTDDLRWLSRGVGKVVVYPELAAAPSRLGAPSVRIAGAGAGVERLIDLDAAARREYEAMKPAIMAAAVTRLATRAAVAEGVRAAGRQESNILGEVLALLFEGALVAADRPDTRSWTMLPGRVLVTRREVPAGRHAVEVEFAGAPEARRTEEVEIPSGGFAAVVVIEPR